MLMSKHVILRLHQVWLSLLWQRFKEPLFYLVKIGPIDDNQLMIAILRNVKHITTATSQYNTLYNSITPYSSNDHNDAIVVNVNVDVVVGLV
jgi:hypothetical protein